MPAKRRSCLLASILAALAACDASVTEPSIKSSWQPTNNVSAVSSSASAAANIGGTWQWRETTVIAARPLTALFFGIVPEGPITRFTCESNGQLTINMLTQSTFSGSATQSSLCTTQSGVVFIPSAVFPATLMVENGEIQGKHFYFDFSSSGVPCPHTGAIRVQEGAAVALHGSADCDLPNASEVGQYKDIHFVAIR